MEFDSILEWFSTPRLISKKGPFQNKKNVKENMKCYHPDHTSLWKVNRWQVEKQHRYCKVLQSDPLDRFLPSPVPSLMVACLSKVNPPPPHSTPSPKHAKGLSLSSLRAVTRGCGNSFRNVRSKKSKL